MIKNLLSYVKKQKEPLSLKENSPEKEFEELSQNLNNFSSFLKKSSNKNLILKDYDILDLKIIEFINKNGRTSIYGGKAAELSKQLGNYYAYFKQNISLYVDEPIIKQEKEQPKIDLEYVYNDLKKRLNNFKESVSEDSLTEDEIENFILLFNDEIKELIKHSDKDHKFKLIDLKNKLVLFYKELQKNYEEEVVKHAYEGNLSLTKSSLSEFKTKAGNIKSLINLEKKTDSQILEINNKVFEIKDKFLENKDMIETKTSGEDKNNLLKELNDSYKEVDSLYLNYVEKLASLEATKSQKITLHINQLPSFSQILKSLKPSPIIRLKTKIYASE